jgi:hypothetical protein
MNLWDSVHRGLDKASKEAARIARTQKLRSTIDGLGRQINSQHDTLINMVMNLFISGNLQQHELLPICQEIVNLQQQLNQTQNELYQVQQGQAASGSPDLHNMPPQSEIPVPPTAAATPGSAYAEATPPPDYQSYSTATPPPPPGVEPSTISSLDTVIQPPPPPPGIVTRRCQACQTEVALDITYCPRCGSFIQISGSEQLPTMRSSAIDESATVRAEPTTPPIPGSAADAQGTVRAEPSTTPPAKEQQSDQQIVKEGEGA